MGVIPTYREPDRSGPAGSRLRSDRSPNRLSRCDGLSQRAGLEQRGGSQSASGEGLPAGVRVERRASGTTVTGPQFYVWDPDHDVALSDAQQLAAVPQSERCRRFMRRRG